MVYMDEIDHRRKEHTVKKWIALLIFLMLASAFPALADAPVPVLPEGDLQIMDVTLRPDTAWTVYAGPGADDPAANEGKARVSANSWVQVLGGEGWGRILVQYAVNDQRLRIGWIDADALAPESDIAIAAADSREVRELRQIVNGMRREMREYLANGNGTPRSFWRRLNERTLQEMQIYERTRRELENEKSPDVWEERNAALRRLGLRTITSPNEAE